MKPILMGIMAWLGIALILFVLFTSLSKTTALDIGGESPDLSGYGILLDDGWTRDGELFCQAIPDKAFSKGFPFTYERGTQPCGFIETNNGAYILNIVSAFAISTVLVTVFAVINMYANKNTGLRS